VILKITHALWVGLAVLEGASIQQACCPRYHASLITTSNFIGPWYHAALLFSGLGSIVLLFVLLFSQQIREDLVRAVYCPAVLDHFVQVTVHEWISTEFVQSHGHEFPPSM